MNKRILLLLTAASALAAQSVPDFRRNAQALVAAQPGTTPWFEALAGVWTAITRDAMTKANTVEDRASAAILARRRADVKNGAGSGSAGTTSSVLNPLLPAAFGFAFENGSVLRTISGNTTTVSINPAGLLCASRSEMVLVSLRESGCYDRWRRFGIALSFDTSRGEKPAAAADLKALENQFAEASVRYEIVNQRTPASKSFQKNLNDWKGPARLAANARNKLEIKLGPLRKEMQEALEQEVASASFKALAAAEKEAKLVDIIGEFRSRISATDPVILQADAAAADQIRASNALYNGFAHGWVATAEYALQRPDVATEAIDTIVPKDTRPPNLHTARLILAKGLTKFNIDFTLNVSASWFQEQRPGMTSLWRDAQVAGDAKFRLRDIPDFGTPVLSVAGLFIHLNQRPLGIEIPTFTGTNINKPGNIGVFQTKLELPTANAAVRIPFSFTYSNRTDLIKESDVRGQIGISLNLDSVFADPSKK